MYFLSAYSFQILAVLIYAKVLYNKEHLQWHRLEICIMCLERL